MSRILFERESLKRTSANHTTPLLRTHIRHDRTDSCIYAQNIIYPRSPRALLSQSLYFSALVVWQKALHDHLTVMCTLGEIHQWGGEDRLVIEVTTPKAWDLNVLGRSVVSFLFLHRTWLCVQYMSHTMYYIFCFRTTLAVYITLIQYLLSSDYVMRLSDSCSVLEILDREVQTSW